MCSPLSILVPLFGSLSGQTVDLRTLVQQALEQPTQLRIENQKLSDAFKQLSAAANVDIHVPQSCYDLLPDGAETKVNAELRNVTLRQGLTELLTPLGMNFDVRERVVEVAPCDALLRVGRRAKWNELETLKTLSQTRWTPGGAGIESLRDRIQFRETPEKDPWSALAEHGQRVGAGKASEVLTLACKALGWTWYPSDEYIVVTPEAKQIARQLEALVSVRQTRRPLLDVLQEVSRATGVRVRTEGDVVAALPATARQGFSLIVEGYSGRVALDQIAAATGLSWRIDGDLVTFFRPNNAPTTAPTGAVQPPTGDLPDPVLLLLTVAAPDGNGQVQIVIRESEMSPELRRFREQTIDEFNRAVEQFSQMRSRRDDAPE